MLNVYLSKLRRLLADRGETLLMTEAAGYVLRVPPEGLDVDRFEALLQHGRRQLADGQAERAGVTLRDALALWRGPALADLAFENFAQNEIARLEELRLAALEARIEADLVLGGHDALVPEIEALMAAHPYREGLRAQLMLALYRSGRQAEALETYRRARQTFSEELGIEPGPRLQALESAILRQDSSLEAARPQAPTGPAVRKRPGFPSRWTVAQAGAFVLLIAALVVGATRDSRVLSPVPVALEGESIAVIDSGTGTIIDEIPVGGRPTGPAAGEGSVWIANRDDRTLLRIDSKSREVVRTMGLAVRPTDVATGAGSVWVLGDRVVLEIDPDINEVVSTVRLPRLHGDRPWFHLEVGEDAVWVCACGATGAFARIDPATASVVSVRRGPVGMIAYGEGSLWALTGYELDTLERIDPKTNTVVETIPVGRIGETHGYPYRMAVASDGIWLASAEALWRLDAETDRFTTSVPLEHRPEGVAAGNGAVWVTSPDGTLLRVDPESSTTAKTIPLGPLIYPVENFTCGAGSSMAVDDGDVWLAVTSFAS